MNAKAYKAMFEAAKEKKSSLRQDMDDIARLIAPTRLPSKWKETKDENITHEHMDTTAQVAIERFAAMLFGFLFPPHTPSVIPTIAGRKTENDEAIWLDKVRDIMHEFFTQDSSSWRTAMSECFLDYAAFGVTACYTSASSGGMPRYQSLSAFNVYWQLDLDRQVMNFFWETSTTTGGLVEKYGDNAAVKKANEKPKDGSQKATLLYVMMKNPAGKKGAKKAAKPFTTSVIWVEEDEILNQGGYDSNPFAVGAMYRRPGEDYATGLGHRVYASARYLNRLKESVRNGAEKSVSPPMFDFTGGELNDVDMRVGAWNTAEWAALGFTDINKALQPLGPTGDLRPGIEIFRDERAQINTICFIDWLQSVADGVRTATEVLDQREMRFRSMAPLVARLESEFLDPIIERSFVLMAKARKFPAMPESLKGEEITFEYRSPLANAQDLGENEAIQSTLNGIAMMAEIDPNVADKPDLDAMADRWAKNTGLPAGLMKPAKDVVAIRDARAKQQAYPAQIAQAQQAASALQSGAQGIATLKGSEGGE